MLTHAPFESSPAVDAGNPQDLAGTAMCRSSISGECHSAASWMPTARVSARIDVGAYERSSDETLSFVVDTLADEDDGEYSLGDRSLREAIEVAIAHPGVDTITFHPDLTAAGPATILLEHGEMVIPDSVTISGPGAQLLTIDAQQQSRIFNVDDTSITNENFSVTLSGLTLTNGRTTGNNPGNDPFGTTYSGGAIRSITLGTLSIDDCLIVDNSTTGGIATGGGIYAKGPLVLNHSVVSGNSTVDGSGGGIFGSSVTIQHSTVSSNSTSGVLAKGGGIFGNLMTIQDSTIVSNSTSGHSASGGGVFGTSVVIARSTVSDNQTTGDSARRCGCCSHRKPRYYG